ncbi:MAG: exonuclease SbcCD subunit D C-terminal domain-containing protein [Porphyromonadaceae bacterium]|nr:exonuclease SbcCD subunit D C-terminal domain-containing protein [Porphyromonadaceae bacterium]
MKIIHTADWHLGQTFFSYDRREEHEIFLDWLCGQIRQVSADVLLLSGDVFDTPNPSAAAQQLFYRFIRRITEENPRLQVVVIAGNHDSAARLEAPNPLLEELHVTVRGIVRRKVSGEIDFARLIIPLGNRENPEAYCLAVPYLRQGDYPPAETYAQGVGALYEALYQRLFPTDKPVIVMGHLQATGAEISENDQAERTIIGGLECVPPSIFRPDIAYVALGHLHRAQQVSRRENVRYAGAPLPMSFAEKNNRHGVVCLTLEGTERKIEFLPFIPPVPLLSIQGDPGTVFKAIGQLPDGLPNHLSPYLEIRIRLFRPEPSLRQRIETALQGKAVRLTRLVSESPEERRIPEISEKVEEEISPLKIAQNYYKKRWHEEMPDELFLLLQQAIREAQP